MTIRVYLVDDHALVRTGMKMILSGRPTSRWWAKPRPVKLRDVRQLLPDVVLCDLHLPGVSGMEVTERIVRNHRNTRVVIVSVLEDGPLPEASCWRRGRGLSARAAMHRSCCARCAMWPWAVATWAPASRRTWPVDGGEWIAVRQPVAARTGSTLLLTQGLRQEDIARRLSLSAKTVNTHKARLFEDGDPRIALARMASQYGLVDPARPL